MGGTVLRGMEQMWTKSSGARYVPYSSYEQTATKQLGCIVHVIIMIYQCYLSLLDFRTVNTEPQGNMSGADLYSRRKPCASE